MRHLLTYEIFESQEETGEFGLVIFLKCEIKDEGEIKPAVVVLMSSGENSRSAIENMLLGMNSKIDDIETTKDLIASFQTTSFTDGILGGKISKVYSVIPYKAIPRGSQSDFDWVWCTYKDVKDFDPTDMGDSDDEDSIVSKGWDTDRIMSKLYGMFKSDRKLFHKIALGELSNMEGGSDNKFPVEPEDDSKAKSNKNALKRGAEDITLLRRSLNRGML
jgi:hypothetical protein